MEEHEQEHKEEHKEEETLVGDVTKKVAEVEVRVLGKRAEECTRIKGEAEFTGRRVECTAMEARSRECTS